MAILVLDRTGGIDSKLTDQNTTSGEVSARVEARIREVLIYMKSKHKEKKCEHKYRFRRSDVTNNVVYEVNRLPQYQRTRKEQITRNELSLSFIVVEL